MAVLPPMPSVSVMIATSVNTGDLREVARLEPVKTDLARLFMSDSARLKMSKAFIAQTLPEALKSLSERHDRFRSLL